MRSFRLLALMIFALVIVPVVVVGFVVELLITFFNGFCISAFGSIFGLLWINSPEIGIFCCNFSAVIGNVFS